MTISFKVKSTIIDSVADANTAISAALATGTTISSVYELVSTTISNTKTRLILVYS